MLVEVTYHGNIVAYNPGEPPVWRTSVWGNDDCGMEFDSPTESDAVEKFFQVISMQYVDRNDLIRLGFVSA